MSGAGGRRAREGGWSRGGPTWSGVLGGIRCNLVLRRPPRAEREQLSEESDRPPPRDGSRPDPHAAIHRRCTTVPTPTDAHDPPTQPEECPPLAASSRGTKTDVERAGGGGRYRGAMSVAVELGELAAKIGEFDFAYLVTVSEEGRAHVLSVWPDVTEHGLVVDGVGRHSQANAVRPADGDAGLAARRSRRLQPARRRCGHGRRLDDHHRAGQGDPPSAGPGSRRAARRQRLRRRHGHRLIPPTASTRTPPWRRRPGRRGRWSATRACTRSVLSRAARRSWPPERP